MVCVLCVTTAEVKCELPLLMLHNYRSASNVGVLTAESTCLMLFFKTNQTVKKEGSVFYFRPGTCSNLCEWVEQVVPPSALSGF